MGGVLFDRPFKLRRLGHVGLNLYRVGEGLRFYKDLLGFRIADVRENVPGGGGSLAERYESLGDLNRYFLRFGSDHHSLVLYNHRFRVATGRSTSTTRTVNQISWQVGSLAEVSDATRWFHERSEHVVRFARDTPGSIELAYLSHRSGRASERALLRHGTDRLGRALEARVMANTSSGNCRRCRRCPSPLNTYAGPPPPPVYYGPGWWYPGYIYGWGPAYGLSIRINGGIRSFSRDRSPISGRLRSRHIPVGP